MARVHCLGVAVVDALSGPLAMYPRQGELTQVVTESVRFMPGGGAVNTAATLAQLGVEVALFTKVGNDANGALIVDTLSSYGVDVSGVCVSRADTTPFTFVGVHPNGERTFIHTPGANRTFTLGDIDERRLLDCEFLLYQDLWVLPGLDGTPGAGLLARARGRGVVTLLDECWGLGPRRDVFEQVAPHADWLLPSFDDMKVIYPGLDETAIAERLTELGAGAVVLKMGAAGCLVRTKGGAERVPADKAVVVDATGAGDSFDAGFIQALAEGADPVAAAGRGVAVAAKRLAVVGGSTPPLGRT
jgi:sugar/nucleoside kinase (ribokinase family)